MELLTPYILEYAAIIDLVTVIVAALIALSSLDDLIVDCLYWLRRISGRPVFGNPVDLEVLNALPQSSLAIMVPAWQEHDVIYSMLTANQQLLSYENYRFFVGVYQNDIATMEEVQRAVAESDKVQLVIVPHPGPTSKADCLNHIASAIADYEAQQKLSFIGLVLHDAEDLIHPYELSLFNFYADRFDFIQLPVFSFNRSLRDLVGGLYMDEFAESHLKDIPVREGLSGLVPCAGVAAMFGRQAIDMIRATGEGPLFRTDSLTEDYDVALRLSLLGARVTFLLASTPYTIDTSGISGRPQIVPSTLPVATREFFPNRFDTARRQRARWLLGIAFQGARSFGWRGSLMVKYFLTRDRKGVLTAPLVFLGYIILASFLLIDGYFQFVRPDIEVEWGYLRSPAVRALLALNLFFLIWRLAHRCYFTTKVYGLAHGLMSIPRLPIANFLNFFAVMRALRLYLAHRILGTKLVWDKTAHQYPIAFLPNAGETPVEPSSDNATNPVKR